MKLLTTKQVAERLGVSIGRIHQLINEGRLPAEKLGRDYVIREGDLKLVEDRRVGRPPKSKAETDSKAGKKKGSKK
jgi:excisionase family DNA binding protein